MNNVTTSVLSSPLERNVVLSNLFNKLKKRRLLILTCLCLTLAFTAFFTFSANPIYEAQATLLIAEESQRSPLTGEVVNYGTYFSEALSFNTHFQVITSRPVLERVLADIPSADSPVDTGWFVDFIGNLSSNIKSLYRSLLVSPDDKKEKRSESPQAQLADKIDGLRRKISIIKVEDTRLLKIVVEDNDPKRAANIANALSNAYIDFDTESKFESSKKLMSWLQNQLYEMRKKVEAAEVAFLKFKEKENIFSVAGKQKLTSSKIAETSSEYIKTRTKRLELEAKIHQLQSFVREQTPDKITTSIPTFLDNKLLEDLYSKLLQASVEYKRLSSVYRSKHPEIIKIKSQIDSLTENIRNEVIKTLANKKSERAVILAREKALLQATDSYEKEALVTNRKELQYSILERDVQTNKELYNILLGKIKEANILEEVNKTNLRVIQVATPPVRPDRPRKLLNLFLGAFFGLIIGVGIALLMELTDLTIHNREEAEIFLKLPVIAEIPLVPKSGDGASSSVGKKVGIIKQNIFDLPLNSRFTEAFQVLCANLRYGQLSKGKGVFLVTSAAPGEGKSTVAFNLGISMSMQGLKTIVIEADLRKPASQIQTPTVTRRGLTDLLNESFSMKVDQGSLNGMSVADLNTLIELQDGTGIMQYSDGPDIFSVYFLKGRVVDIDWPSRPAEDRLGNLLVMSGRITKEQANVALERQKKTSQRLGQVLLKLGFVSVEALAGPLKLQMQENLIELYRRKPSSYTFTKSIDVESRFADRKEKLLLDAMGEIDVALNSRSIPYLQSKIKENLLSFNDQSFSFLPAGRPVMDTYNLLSSKRMQFLVEILRNSWDLVIIDSPPAGMISDTSILATMCDGIIFTIHAGKTGIREARLAKQQIENINVNMLGTVVNSLDIKSQPYYYRRYYGRYGSYYDHKPNVEVKDGSQKHIQLIKSK